MWKVAWISLALMACSGSGAGGDDTGGSGDGGDGGSSTGSFEDFVNVTTAPTGDFTGFASFEENGGAWITQNVDTSLQVDAPFEGTILDFQDNYSIEDATFEMWYADEVAGAPDLLENSDGEGKVSGQAPACSPHTYKISTDPTLGDTKVTFEAHEVFGAGGDTDVEFNSVSSTTYQLIPALLGISPDPVKGIAAGAVYDVNGDPVSGAQVIVTDGSGKIAGDVIVQYFVDDFPNREQYWTSEDGLWVAINIPTGTWNVTAWVSDGAGGHKQVGATSLGVQADSINISSIYVGVGDGVAYPDSCLLAR